MERETWDELWENPDAEIEGDEESPLEEEQPEQEEKEKEETAPAVPPELRDMISNLSSRIEALQGLDQRVRSTEGKIGDVLSQMKQARESIGNKQDQPTVEDMRKAIESHEEMEELKEQFPLWAERFEKLSASEQIMAQELEQLKANMPDTEALRAAIIEEAQSLTANKTQEQLKKDAQILAEHYPNAYTDYKSKEFADWKEKQPLSIKMKAQSDRLVDAVDVMERFYADKDKKKSSKSRLESAVSTPRGKTPRSKSEQDMTQAELWNAVQDEVWKD